MGDNSALSSTTAVAASGSGAFSNKLAGKSLLVSLTFFFLAIIFILFIFIYAQRNWGVRSATRRRRRRRTTAQAHLILVVGNNPVPSLGLDHSVLLSLPTIIYRPSDYKEAADCAVCLTELADGDKARFLPKCNHGFHLECIDMWFSSQSTCPLCRCPVIGGEEVGLSETPALHMERPGLEGERILPVSTEMLQSSLPPAPSIESQVEEVKLPVEEDKTPVLLKVGSLRRILSRGKGASSLAIEIGDVEQGVMRCGGATGEGS